MVIISTMAIEVSIQAVSPELGVQFVERLGIAGGRLAAAAAGAAAVRQRAAWLPPARCRSLRVGGMKVGTLSTIPSRIAPARAISPARENFFNDMVSLLSVEIEVRRF